MGKQIFKYNNTFRQNSWGHAEHVSLKHTTSGTSEKQMPQSQKETKSTMWSHHILFPWVKSFNTVLRLSLYCMKMPRSAFQKLSPEVSSGVPVRAQDSASLREVLLLLPWSGHSKSRRQLCSYSTLRGARLKCVCVFASFGHSVTSKNGDLEQGYICNKASKNVTISLERAV